MTKYLCFFNHKGGVGKTTLAYNIAWALADSGKRSLLIDADAQCNLSEISMENIDDFPVEDSIYEYFSGYLLPDLDKGIPEAKLYNKRENLALLPGSIRFAELEESIALSLANIAALRHIPASAHTALQNIGNGFDYVIIDLSPALSATNRLLLMLSDYFILPVNPSIFSMQALRNLNSIFRDWNRTLSGFEIFSRKLKNLPKLLGIVCQNYRPYSREDEKNTQSAKRFEQSMEQLNSITLELASDLNSFGMAVTPTEFSKLFEDSIPYRIANIPDYNQLKVLSESEKIPVSAFTPAILNKYALNTKQYREKVEDFFKECQKIVSGILKLP